jgi:hypothetical protein
MFRSLFTNFTYAGSGCPGRGARRAMARAATLAAITLLALGTLSGTAQAQSVFNANLRLKHIMPTVPWVGGGDADVYTKSGRYTDVSVQTGVPYVYPDGLSGYIPVLYEIKEVSPDYTVLQKVDIVRFYPPTGYRIVNTAINRVPANFYRRYSGEDHFWHNATAAVQGTYLESLVFQFDGSGRDDQGNAQLYAEICIGVELAKL